MCGIAFLLEAGLDSQEVGGGHAAAVQQHTHTGAAAAHFQRVAALEATIAPRGPDMQGRHAISLDAPNMSLVLLASVLHMRGAKVCEQPAVDPDTGNVLLWNGEIFGGSFGSADDDCVITPGPTEGDTQAVLWALSAWRLDEERDISEHILRTMADVQGPWAMVFYHKSTQTLHFGRDRLGRRSLVMRVSTQGEWLAVCSSASAVGCSQEEEDEGVYSSWTEVKVEGLWRLNLSSPLSDMPSPELLPWPPSFPSEPHDVLPASLPEAAGMLLQKLNEAVRRRVAAAPMPLPPSPNDENNDYEGRDDQQGLDLPARVAVLYSGGLDCQVLATIAHLQLSNEGDTHTPLDLINVCFDQGKHQSPDRLAALAGWLELRSLYPSRPWRLLLVNVDDYESQVKAFEKHLRRLIQPCHTPMDFNIACAFYHAARGVGHLASPTEAARVLHEAQGGEGLLRYGKSKSSAVEDGPQKGEGEMKENPGPCSNTLCRRVFKPGCAKRLCGNCCIKAQKKANWLTVTGAEVDCETEVLAVPPCRVHKLGKKWTMPSSSAAAPPPPPSPSITPDTASCSPSVAYDSGPRYRSLARIVLLGIGADEQLAGYGRHRSTFRRGGDEALAAELVMDLGRLWTRNLGRDDRCVAVHSREARFPYLDECVMSFLRTLPMPLKFSLNEPMGVGDKKILRYVASEVLGLKAAAALVKRAIQFGSRISREASAHTFGSHRAGKQRHWKKKATSVGWGDALHVRNEGEDV